MSVIADEEKRIVLALLWIQIQEAMVKSMVEARQTGVHPFLVGSISYLLSYLRRLSSTSLY